MAAALLASATASAQLLPSEANPTLIRLYARSQAPVTQGADCLIISNNGNDLQPSRHAWGDGSSGHAFCGFATARELGENGQAVWWVRGIFLPDWNVPSLILEYRRPGESTGRCLVSDASGDATRPSLDSKPGGSGPYCGWTQEEIVAEQRAAWNIVNHALVSAKTGNCLIFGNNGQDIRAQMYRWPDVARVDKEVDFCGLPSYQALAATGQATFRLDATTLLPLWKQH